MHFHPVSIIISFLIFFPVLHAQIDEQDSTISKTLSPRLRENTVFQDSIHTSLDFRDKALVHASKDKLEEATKLFYDGLTNSTSEKVFDDLYKEMRCILTPDEQKEYKKSQNRGELLRRFWSKRDPTPATFSNERIFEHWSRQEYATQWFQSFDIRGYDDRGEIYVRYGQPDHRIQMMESASLYSNECWVYKVFGDEIIFEFINRHGTFELLVPDPNNISPIVATANSQGEVEKLFLFIRPRMAVSYQYTPIGIQLQDLRFADAISEQPILEVRQQLKQVFLDNEVRRYKLSVSTSSIQREEEELNGALSLARFYPDSISRSEIYIGIPCNELTFKETAENEYGTILDISYMVVDSLFDKIETRNIQKTMTYAEDSSWIEEVFVDQINQYLPAGKYSLALEIREDGANKSLEETFQFEIPEYLPDQIGLSDIELSYEIRPAEIEDELVFLKDKLFIKPHPFQTVQRMKPVFVYFEIYNLLLGPSGLTSYEVEYELRSTKRNFISKIFPFGRKTSLSSSYKQEGTERNIQEYFEFNLREMSTGEYKLIVRVEDKIQNETKQSEIPIQIVDES